MISIIPDFRPPLNIEYREATDICRKKRRDYWYYCYSLPMLSVL